MFPKWTSVFTDFWEEPEISSGDEMRVATLARDDINPRRTVGAREETVEGNEPAIGAPGRGPIRGKDEPMRALNAADAPGGVATARDEGAAEEHSGQIDSAAAKMHDTAGVSRAATGR